jgi:HlyD family secretion protein
MMRRAAVAGAVVLLAGLAGFAWVGRGASRDVESTEVTRGPFVDAVSIRGEIKAGRSETLEAPSDAGDLRIVKLPPDGSAVKAGDVVVEFDGSTVAQTLAQKQTEVRQYDAEIEKAKSEARAKEQADVTAVANAKFQVEHDTLEYSAKDILSRVEAEQRRLKVLDSEQQLAEAEARLKSDRIGGRADLTAAEDRRAKAEFDMAKARRQLDALRITAPVDGFITLLPNFRAGNFDSPPPFREGDRAWAGASIAEVPDLSTLYASARVDEVERGRLSLNQPATVRLEALPDRQLAGHVSAISALAKADFSTWPPPRNFDVSIAVDDRDPRVRPGMTASIRVAVETLHDVLLVPVRAIFSKDGESVVYVLGRGAPERRVVDVGRRNQEQAVILHGLAAGDRVALSDPTVEAPR